MELKKFLEKFLPDCEAKRADSNKHLQSARKQNFEHYYFPEALENFTDKICKEQREFCANTAESELMTAEEYDEIKFIENENGETCFAVIIDNIETAEQPNMEEL
jgi:dynactin complex subunit